MTSLAFSALASWALCAASGETYAEAHRQTTETGRPLVVLVSADWCPACQVMQQTVIPEARRRGLLRKVAFAVVNYDREQDLAAQLTEHGPIPQVVMYRRTAKGWLMWRTIGAQSVDAFEQFLHQGLEFGGAAPEGREPSPTAQRPEKSSG